MASGRQRLVANAIPRQVSAALKTGSGVDRLQPKKKWDSEKTPAVFEKRKHFFFFWGGGQRVVEFCFGILKKKSKETKTTEYDASIHVVSPKKNEDLLERNAMNLKHL